MRDTKHLGKHASKLAEKAKEKALFRAQRKAVEAGAHGTLISLATIIHFELYRMRRMFHFINFFKF